MFYTGIPDTGTFHLPFDEMNDITIQRRRKNSQTGRPRVLQKLDEFFIMLMRLRLGILIEDLSRRFHISSSTCGEIIKRWITYLGAVLSFFKLH
jgi:hypothetical protein